MQEDEAKTRIGFVPQSLRGSIAFPEPRLLRKARSRPLSRMAVQACPAVNGFEKRVIEILAPYSLQVRCVAGPDGRFDFHSVPHGTRLAENRIAELFRIDEPARWRRKSAPVVQVSLPHFFVCDSPCYLSMMPAWASADGARLPGQMVSGRYPAHMWPRVLNLAFEWSDLGQDFKMSRGQPVAYVYAETETPEAPIELVPAKMTQELAVYRSRMDGVADFTSDTLSLVDALKAYRPAKLLQEA